MRSVNIKHGINFVPYIKNTKKNEKTPITPTQLIRWQNHFKDQLTQSGRLDLCKKNGM